jgi:molybdopterin-binding protein
MATWPTVTDDDGSGTTGTILDQSLFNSVRDYIGASWTDVAFSAGNFTANGSMTWTVASGDVTSYRWIEIGKTMIVSVYLSTTSVGGTVNSELRVAVPNGRNIASTSQSFSSSGSATVVDNGVFRAGTWVASPGATYVSVRVAFTGTWTLSTDNTYVAATFIFPID